MAKTREQSCKKNKVEMVLSNRLTDRWKAGVGR